MRKLVLLLMLIFTLTFSNSVFALAGSVSETQPNATSFSIISGIDLSKDVTSTFEQTITITGKAVAGSTVEIVVYEKLPEKKEQLKVIDRYSIVVGASGYFSQTVNLVVGENVININVTKGKSSESITTTIKRKKSEIKTELEKSVLLSRTRK